MREAVGRTFDHVPFEHADLVAGGSNWEEIERLAQRVEHAGANIINTGIGWHEARIPTIATMVPGGIPVCHKETHGAVNVPWSPPTASTIRPRVRRPWQRGVPTRSAWPGRFWPTPFGQEGALVSCPRHQHLHWMQSGVLDHVFKQKVSSCLVNPRPVTKAISRDSSTRSLAKRRRTRRQAANNSPAGGLQWSAAVLQA